MPGCLTKEQVADNIQRLVRARVLIDEVMNTLDHTAIKCGHCGQIRSSDKKHTWAWEKLRAYKEGLQKVKGWLLGSDEDGQGQEAEKD